MRRRLRHADRAVGHHVFHTHRKPHCRASVERAVGHSQSAIGGPRAAPTRLSALAFCSPPDADCRLSEPSDVQSRRRRGPAGRAGRVRPSRRGRRRRRRRAGRCSPSATSTGPIFPRSAVKALQALPLIESGAADRLGLSEPEIALACASHSGEDAHVALAAGMLAKAGATRGASNAARTGRSARRRRARSRVRAEAAGALHNNCSGKHAGFICLACADGVDPKGYVAPGSPCAARRDRALADVTRRAARTRRPRGVDGCSIPAYAIPLRALALGFARFATGQGLAPERARAAARIRAAVAAHPAARRRAGRFDTEAMTIARRPRLHQDRRRGRLLRRAAGTRPRPRGQGRRRRRARGAGDDRGASRRFGGFDGALNDKLAPFVAPRLRNWRAVDVGALQPAGPLTDHAV